MSTHRSGRSSDPQPNARVERPRPAAHLEEHGDVADRADAPAAPDLVAHLRDFTLLSPATPAVTPFDPFAGAVITDFADIVGQEHAKRALEVAVVDHVAGALDATLDDAVEGTHRVGRLVTEAEIADPDAKIALAREAMARASVLESVAIYARDGKLIDTIAKNAGAPLVVPEVVPEVALGAAPGAFLPVEIDAAGRAILRYLEPVVRDGAR